MSGKDRKKARLPMEAPAEFGDSPFASLDSAGLPEGLPPGLPDAKVSLPKDAEKWGNGERLEVRREKTGRGGKTVTTVRGIPPGLGADRKKRLLKEMKNRLGTGGIWSGQDLELQGDKRAEVMEWMRSLGYRPVLAGG